ncbi:hypothetical protein HWQ46_08085 [Shewanella sp. D64]|uniref:hypothetical protein n=1 Tax=unclassified Shewanella TaxID=196818 RepID=UPI0022BA65A5|nr:MULTISPECIES: hypothetical protein [unclassified Shewanella]MEC4725503.1 hypothetical protein [Shewanella sp. D64]MEC4738678.1 hypothetical protein [Shewanella sp. E94]WBJ94975.1 hypothetical protein HWQ47_24610 [Shewanella sp. MTB7]
MKIHLLLLLALMAGHSNTALAAKDPIKGFVSRGDLKSTINGFTSNRNGFDDPNIVISSTGGPQNGPLRLGHLVDAILVQAEWRTLEPSEGRILRNNVVDKAINSLSTWNRQNPSYPLSIKLRVFAGMYSPQWLALDRRGNPIFCSYKHKTNNELCFVQVSTKNGKNGNIPSYWKSAYASKWKNFHRKMANKYDNNNLIREVSLGGCAIGNDESFWRHKGDNTPNGGYGLHVVRYLMNKGLTLEKDKACLQNTQFDAMTAWNQTPVGVSYNIWNDYRTNGRNLIWSKNKSFTRKVMQKCVDHFGSRCLIGNNSYGNRDLGSENDSQKFAFMLKLAGTAATWHRLSSQYSFIRNPQGTYIQTEVWAALKNSNKDFVGGEDNEIHVAIDRARTEMKIHSAEIPKLRDLAFYDTFLGDIYLATDRMQNVRQALKN